MKVKLVPLIEVFSNRFQEYSEKELYSIIICGEAKVGDETVREPRRKIRFDADVSISSRKWVSRGGEKLEHALKEWDIDAVGKVVLDAGASTGGFTDCLLQRGALLVHSVDVGYNQLDYRLRTDNRVNVLERTNIMSVENLEPEPHLGVADLSFRSITGAASHILSLTKDNLLIALIKPQFELPETKNFDGVIREQNILIDVLLKTAVMLEKEDVKVYSVIESPIKGGKGNTEFLFLLRIRKSGELISNEAVIKEFLAKKY